MKHRASIRDAKDVLQAGREGLGERGGQKASTLWGGVQGLELPA